MSMRILESVIKKVPGHIPVESKSEKQGYIGDLKRKSKLELLDLLSRQNRLLNNKTFINKLPDKGERITKFREEIEAELDKRNESERLAEMLIKLNINGKEGLDSLEWSGKCAPGYVIDDNLEDSDDETDPLKILATHSGAGFHKKKHRILKPEKSLIKSSDLEEKGTHNQNNLVVEDEYAKVLRSKLDAKSNGKERFLPHRTINPSKTTQMKDKKLSKNWEVTAATPPLPVHGDTKLVTLEESIHLQYDQEQKLKDLQLKYAAERLASSSLTMRGIPLSTTEYRDKIVSSSSEEESEGGEDVEVEEEEVGGVVVYNLIDA